MSQEIGARVIVNHLSLFSGPESMPKSPVNLSGQFGVISLHCLRLWSFTG